MASLEKCMTLQDPSIPLPPAPRATDEWVTWQVASPIPEEPMGNGEFVQTDVDHSSAIGGGWA